MKVYLHELLAGGSAESASVTGGIGTVVDGVGLAAVKVLGLDDLVDGLVATDGSEGAQLVGVQVVDLRSGQAVEGDGGAAVASHGIFEDGEGGVGVLVGEGRPVKDRAIGAASAQVNLQLTGDALLEVDDPQRLVSANLDAGELFTETMAFKIQVSKFSIRLLHLNNGRKTHTK